MQYTKPMIDLVYEIRRRVEPDVKPGVKMANPELLKELADYYHQAKDTITKTLIKELLTLAGNEWRALLQASGHKSDLAKQVVKVYRGQTTLEEAPKQDIRTGLLVAPPPAKPIRMYRGHPVD
ncbi:MAG: hypothetical protein B0W54_12905 [Cellvibrio sp. 79]|nr:MAG: hypothetical protein B0W54_12905 [Cellvibrio sp. 79]